MGAFNLVGVYELVGTRLRHVCLGSLWCTSGFSGAPSSLQMFMSALPEFFVVTCMMFADDNILLLKTGGVRDLRGNHIFLNRGDKYTLQPG